MEHRMKTVSEHHIACPVCGSRVNESYHTVAGYQITAFALGITPQMGAVMDVLLSKPVATREELLGAMALLGITDEHATHHLKVAISRLRRQIEHRGWKINNVYRLGYALESQARDEALKIIEATREAFEKGNFRSAATEIPTFDQTPLN
jgi:hypothetical protein